jgi:Xaa-Pro aminopeptidase
MHPGMVITIEPEAYVPSMLVDACLEDIISIHDHGAEILSAIAESESDDQY